jgi:hypothetical protein
VHSGNWSGDQEEFGTEDEGERVGNLVIAEGFGDWYLMGTGDLFMGTDRWLGGRGRGRGEW